MTDETTILGIGTARGGTQSLACWLQKQGLEVGHEKTTSLDWRREKRPQRYARTFRYLQKSRGDVACWLTQAIFDLMEDLEDPKCLALLRDKEPTVESLAATLQEKRIRKARKFSGYPFPNYTGCPEREAWARYWQDYRRVVAKLTAAYPERALCVPLEDLETEAIQQEMGEFLELEEVNTVKSCHEGKREDR